MFNAIVLFKNLEPVHTEAPPRPCDWHRGFAPMTPKKQTTMAVQKTKEKRTVIVKLRFTQKEHEQLVAMKTSHHLAAWCREALLSRGTNSRTSPRPKTDPSLLRALAALGNNLNQIARRLNTRKDLLISERLQALIDLSAIRNHLRSLKSSQTNDR